MSYLAKVSELVHDGNMCDVNVDFVVNPVVLRKSFQNNCVRHLHDNRTEDSKSYTLTVVTHAGDKVEYAVLKQAHSKPQLRCMMWTQSGQSVQVEDSMYAIKPCCREYKLRTP